MASWIVPWPRISRPGRVLETITILLTTAALVVPVSRRLGLGSVLGTLAGGAAIGPSGLGLITDVADIAGVSEFGVVMLLFLIGLDIRPQRLWLLRRTVFGLGSAQLLLTGTALAGCAVAMGLPWPAAVVVGAGLALSSTAMVLPILSERGLLQMPSGRSAFSVLLFQDLAFIPLIAAVPLLTGTAAAPDHMPWLEVGRIAGAIVVILVGGRLLIRPAFRAVGGAGNAETFIVLALLTVAGAATLAKLAGLSMSLGAFLGGMLLSDSEYRHEIQADVEPFEGLLLSFFFLATGMSADLGAVARDPWFFAAAVPGLILVKALAAYGVGRAGGQLRKTAVRFALSISQGSEFSFVLFGAAVAAGSLAPEAAGRLTLVISLSMAATPLLFAASERWVVSHMGPVVPPAFDAIPDEGAPVIICGFGRVGQVVGRILQMRGVAFTALERDPFQVEVVRRFGNAVYYGDPTRPDLLRAAGASRACLLVVALDDMEQSLRVVEMARRTFPDLRIIARARNRRHAHLLMDRGIEDPVREAFHSSLVLGRMALESLGATTDAACHAVRLFRASDERELRQSQAFHDDEQHLIQSARQAAEELASLFEADQAEWSGTKIPDR